MGAAAARRRAPLAAAIGDEARAVLGEAIGRFVGAHHELFPPEAFETPEEGRVSALPKLAQHVVDSVGDLRVAMPNRWEDVELSARWISELTPRILNLIDVGRDALPPTILGNLVTGVRHLNKAEESRSEAAVYKAQQGEAASDQMMRVYAKVVGGPLVSGMVAFASAYLELRAAEK